MEKKKPTHLPPKPSGQVVQVSSQMNQLHLQSGGAKEVVHESHQPVSSVHILDDLEDEASWTRGQI